MILCPVIYKLVNIKFHVYSETWERVKHFFFVVVCWPYIKLYFLLFVDYTEKNTHNRKKCNINCIKNASA